MYVCMYVVTYAKIVAYSKFSLVIKIPLPEYKQRLVYSYTLSYTPIYYMKLMELLEYFD